MSVEDADENVGESDNQTGKALHAHFDCFSGAAGNMMLAACLDAADDGDGKGGDGGTAAAATALLERIAECIRRGLPALDGEFEIRSQRVWRGEGSIAALHVKVLSVYDHEAAPVPLPAEEQRGADVHDHSHQHSHGHSHSRDHTKHHHERFTKYEGGASPDHQAGGNSHNYEHGQHSHNHNHTTGAKGPLRNLPEIRQMLLDAPEQYIPAQVRDRAIETFTELAKAEASVHGASSVDAVHFHEVGAVDSIVDTVGTLLALHFLGVKTVSCSRLPLGEGAVKTDHGILPVPAPATLRLMVGMPTTPGPPGLTGELVTPTGAALLRTLTSGTDSADLRRVSPAAGRPPRFTLRKVGVGAGTKNFKRHPNVLRLLLGDEVLLLEDRNSANQPKKK